MSGVNHCLDCNSTYTQPGTCNCFAPGGKRALTVGPWLPGPVTAPPPPPPPATGTYVPDLPGREQVTWRVEIQPATVDVPAGINGDALLDAWDEAVRRRPLWGIRS